MLELFERVTAEVTNNATVWSLYARLLGSCASDNAMENDKVSSQISGKLLQVWDCIFSTPESKD